MDYKNKKIVKNSFWLYIRLLLTMPVAFYTSRILLQQLGVTDFGIYNAVGGIVTMFASLRAAFASATQRFYNYEIGKGNINELNKIFNVSLLIHIAIALCLVLIIELVGFWFIQNKLVVPIGRLSAVYWIFQCSILSTVFVVLMIPFDAMIIARERMGFYAYLSIIDVILKLLMVLSLIYIDVDKLKMYASFVAMVSFIVFLLSIVYCRRNFKELRVQLYWNKSLFIKMGSFASWNLIGNMAYTFVNEGANILLNLFGGVIANAARGITYQIKNTVTVLLGNAMTAMRPQATQEYAAGNTERFFSMIIFSSKFLFFMAAIIAIPLFFYVEKVLMIWLGQVPQYSVIFIKIVLFQIIVRSYHEPLDVIFKSSGRVKSYQLLSTILSVSIFPIAYFLLKNDYPVYVVFIVMLVLELVIWIALVLLASREGLSIKQYFIKVVLPSICILLLFLLVGYLFSFYVNDYIQNTVLEILCLVSLYLLIVFLIGLSKNERIVLLSAFFKK